MTYGMFHSYVQPDDLARNKHRFVWHNHRFELSLIRAAGIIINGTESAVKRSRGKRQ